MVHADPDEIRRFADSLNAVMSEWHRGLAALDGSLRAMTLDTPDPAIFAYQNEFQQASAQLRRALAELAAGGRRLRALAGDVDAIAYAPTGAAPSAPSPPQLHVAGYAPGHGFRTRGGVPLVQLGVDALRDNIVWDEPDFPQQFEHMQHHLFVAADYLRFVRKLPTAMALLRSNRDPSTDEDDDVRAAYAAFFAETEHVVIEKTPGGWRVTSGRHRIMACITTGVSCLAEVRDRR